MKRRWYSVPRDPFILDGNSKTFALPTYEPLLDKNLITYHEENRVFDKLKNMKILNRKYEIVDKELRKKILRKTNLSLRDYNARKLNVTQFYKYSNLKNPVKTWVMSSPSKINKKFSTVSR
jgi:hypothetical protein